MLNFVTTSRRDRDRDGGAGYRLSCPGPAPAPQLITITIITELASNKPTSGSFADVKLSVTALGEGGRELERNFPACCLVRVFCHFYSIFFKLVKMT